MKFGAINSFIAKLIAVIAAALFCAIAWMRESYSMLMGAVFLLIYFIVILYKHYRKDRKRINLMLNAIESNDFSFRFNEDFAYGNDEQVAQILNHIIGILRQTRDDAVEKERYYELIINSVSTGIVVLDSNGFVYQVNQEALRNLGLPVFTHISQLKKLDDGLFSVFETAMAGENRQITFSNERGAVSLSLRISETTILGKAVRVFALHDINNELDDKEIESWMKLTRVLTHEIMNSITPIISISNTLLSRSQTDEVHRNGIETIHNTANGLISFVESYRKYSSIPLPSPALFYLSPFLKEVLSITIQEDSEIEIITDVQPENLLLYADENLIRQVMINLLRNALQALKEEERGYIKIKAFSNENEEVVIEVTDNGGGIPTDISKNIFTPFFTTKAEGNGIGLTISRQIMRLSGGALNLKSAPQKRETTFILTFQ